MTDEQHKELMAAIERLGVELTSDQVEWNRAVRTAAQIVSDKINASSLEYDCIHKEDARDKLILTAELIYECYGYGDITPYSKKDY